MISLASPTGHEIAAAAGIAHAFVIARYAARRQACPLPDRLRAELRLTEALDLVGSPAIPSVTDTYPLLPGGGLRSQVSRGPPIPQPSTATWGRLPSGGGKQL